MEVDSEEERVYSGWKYIFFGISFLVIVAFIALCAGKKDEKSETKEGKEEEIEINTEYLPMPTRNVKGLIKSTKRGQEEVPVILQTNKVMLGEYRRDVKFDELELVEQIGSGIFGNVYSGTWKGKPIACKQLASKVSVDIDNFLNEVELMRKIPPHQNLVGYLGAVASPPCLITELMPNGSVFNHLFTDEVITNHMKLKVIVGTAHGMRHLAKYGIVHRDLAARNILLSNDWEPKISDFGMSRMLGEEEYSKTASQVGPLKWMSPELMLERIYSEKSDVWSFGVFLLELLLRTRPYPDMKPLEVASKIATQEMKLPIPRGIPIITQLMNDTQIWDPEERISFATICERLEHVDVDENDQFIEI